MYKRLTIFLVCLLVLAFPLSSFAATSNLYTVRGTAISFKASGGTYVINMDGMTTLTGVWSAQADLGASPQPSVYDWTCNIRMNTNGVLGEHTDIYIAIGDGTNIAGAPLITSSAGTLSSGAGPISVTTQLPNLLFLGSVYVDVSDSTKAQTVFGTITLNERYASLVVFNNTTKTLNSTANVNFCNLIPVYYQAQ